ncbi:hypothetical protein [Amycolatopsis sp. cmx-4-68]|uniref:hypothetical protein n=1 Tax=Amycolatopsis sp. cmx-4-68 TaxID=2790938 RepID=UPI00397A0085
MATDNGDTPVPAGVVPAGWFGWPAGEPEVLLLSSDGAYRALPAVLRLLRDKTDRPALSLTLVLSRRPRPDEESVADLVELGHLGFELSLAAPEDAVAAAASQLAAPVQPLFARSATAALVPVEGGVPCATAEGAGTDAVLALDATLPREAALDVLAALAGTPSALAVRASIGYDIVPAPREVWLRGRWADVHDRLAAAADVEGMLRGTAVRACLTELLADGTVRATVDGTELAGGLVPDSSGPVVTAWLKAVGFLLSPQTPELPSGDPASTYRLKARPSPSFPLDFRMTATLPGRGQVDIAAPLDELLGGVLDGLDPDIFIRLVVPDFGGDGGFTPVPRRRDTARGTPDRVVDMVVDGGSVHALPLVLTPDPMVRPSAGALLVSLPVRPVFADASLHRWALDDLVLAKPPPVDDGEPARPWLPLVDDPGAPYWPDAARADVYWYAPAYQLLPVTAELPLESGGFLFSFARTGDTAFTGRVRFRLSRFVPARTEKALAAIGAGALAVATGPPSVSLEVPFTDSATGQARSQQFVATVREDAEGTVVADVDLLDSWVRLAYGALSLPGFQAQPPKLRVSYTYRACQTTNAAMMRAAVGGKTALLGGGTARGRSGEIAVPAGRLVFTPVPGTAVSDATVFVHPALKPPIIYEPGDPVVAPTPDFTVLSMVEEQVSPATYPCATFPERYRQRFPEGERPVGCQDVLRLGDVAYRQFAELTELSEAFAGHCRVHRSLQQPGVFLVVPTRYRITRFSPDERPERAYRPAIVIYAVLNPPDPRYHISATLEPDLPPDVRRDLEHRLIAYSPTGFPPRLVLPTDPAVQATDRYTWATGAADDVPQVRRVADSLQVTLSTGLANALLLTRMIEGAGYSGTVTFTLPDGVAVDAQLLMDSFVTGPWRTGPVTTEAAAGVVTLTNRIERVVNVPELLTENASGVPGRVATGLTLAPGDTATVAVPPDVARVWPRSAQAGGRLTIEELDVFVEDVHTELVLVNQIAYGNHALSAVRAEARVAGRDVVQAVADLAAQGETRLALVLPVTKYLGANGAELRFTRRMTDGTTTTGAWLPWDLPSKGNVISVDWPLVE